MTTKRPQVAGGNGDSDAGSPLTKGTGTSPAASFVAEEELPLGASPLSQRAAIDPIGSVLVCGGGVAGAWSASSTRRV